MLVFKDSEALRKNTQKEKLSDEYAGMFPSWTPPREKASLYQLSIKYQLQKMENSMMVGLVLFTPPSPKIYWKKSVLRWIGYSDT